MNLDAEDINDLVYGKLEEPFCCDYEKYSNDGLCCYALAQLFPDNCAYFSEGERLCGYCKENN